MGIYCISELQFDQYLFLTSLVGLVLSTTILLPRDKASLQADTHFCHVPRLSYGGKQDTSTLL